MRETKLTPTETSRQAARSSFFENATPAAIHF